MTEETPIYGVVPRIGTTQKPGIVKPGKSKQTENVKVSHTTSRASTSTVPSSLR